MFYDCFILDNMKDFPTDKNFSKMDLHGLDYSGTDLTNAIFENTNLNGARFIKSSLTNATFRNAKLEGANFESAILQGADFRKADLKNANLVNTYSIWTDFRGADLTNSNFRGSNLDASRFNDAILEKITLNDISYDRATTWPDGFEPYKLILTIKVQDIISIKDLVEFIQDLSKSRAIDYQYSLEYYLRSIQNIISNYKDQPVTANLLAQIIYDAFSYIPLEDAIMNKYGLIAISSKVNEEFIYLDKVLLNHITELRSIDKKSENLSLLQDWNNLQIEDYLAAGVAGFYAHYKNNKTRNSGYLSSEKCSWGLLTDVLQFGKVYE